MRDMFKLLSQKLPRVIKFSLEEISSVDLYTYLITVINKNEEQIKPRHDWSR
jgi:hypothetical protein